MLASQLFERAGLIECRLRHGGIASRASLGQVTVETCDLAAQLFLETPQLAGVIGLEAHHLLRVLAFQVADRGLVLRNIRAAKLLDGVFDRLGILRLELFAKLGECRITLVRRMVVQRRELGTVASTSCSRSARSERSASEAVAARRARSSTSSCSARLRAVSASASARVTLVTWSSSLPARAVASRTAASRSLDRSPPSKMRCSSSVFLASSAAGHVALASASRARLRALLRAR